MQIILVLIKASPTPSAGGALEPERLKSVYLVYSLGFESIVSLAP